MNPSQLSQFLSYTINANLPVLITGAPGVGKSDSVAAAATAANADLIISHPVVADPTDAKGLPWPKADQEEATFLPFGELAKAIKATNPTVWFLDDLGQASPAVQASFMQLILARRVNGHELPPCVTFVAATNRRQDRAGVTGILEPVKSRFASIVELEADLQSWCQWALTANIQPELIAFLRFKPELLHKFEASADITNQPCPRTWAHASKMIALKLPNDLEFEGLKGAVGQGAATELLAFLQLYRQMPSLDAILLNPDTAPIPTNPATLYAVSSGLAFKATDKNFDRVVTYGNRLFKSGIGEYGALMIKDAVKRTPLLANTHTFIQFASSEFGTFLQGGK